MVKKKPTDAELRVLKKNDPAEFEEVLRSEESEVSRTPPAEVVPAEAAAENWVLVENGVVSQKRPYQQDENYILAPEGVVPGFVFKDGEFTAPVHDAETIWYNVRRDRDQLLAQSDWTQIPDAPLTDGQKLKWKAYRQELRDLTKNNEDPANVTWPKKPA